MPPSSLKHMNPATAKTLASSKEIDVSEILSLAVEFRAALQGLKDRLHPTDFEWYAYDSLGNFVHLDRLLTGHRRFLLDLLGQRPLLDVGCQDGDLSFFL